MEAQSGYQLPRRFNGVKVHIVRRNRPPIFPVHRALDHEPDAKAAGLEVVHLENPVAVEQVPRLFGRK